MRRRLGEVLVAHGVIDQMQLDELLAQQAVDHSATTGVGSRRRLGQLVVDQGLGTEEQVAEALGDLLALDVVDLAVEPVDPAVAQLIPRTMAERFGLVVLAREATGLRVAASDPTNVLALDDVGFALQLEASAKIPVQIGVQKLFKRSTIHENYAPK